MSESKLAQRSLEPEEMLMDVVKALEKNEFENVEGYFGGDMESKTSELPDAWEKTKGMFGEFNGFSGSSPLSYSETEDKAVANVYFGEKEFEIKASFNEEKEMTSFNIQPVDGAGSLGIIKYLLKTKIMGAITGVGETLGVVEPRSVKRERKTREVLELISQGKYAETYSHLDGMVKDMLEVEEVEGMWEKVIEKYGEINEIRDLEYVEEESQVKGEVVFGGEVEDVAVNFGRTGVTAIAIDEENETEYEAPNYASPDSFTEEEVRVGGFLEGTLTLPDSDEFEPPYPAVVLVHGTGSLDRDETVNGNKPFKDLAWGLASRGIAVLRYDKRTNSTPLDPRSEEFTIDKGTVNDSVAATELLQDFEEIGSVSVLGHSLGGYMAPEIADRAPVEGIISLGGPSRHLSNLIVEQMEDGKSNIREKYGDSDDDQEVELTGLREKAERVKNDELEDDEVVLNYSGSFWKSLRGYNPVEKAKDLETRFFVLHGGKDFQVSDEDFEKWKNGLGDKPNVEFKRYPELSHLFAETSEDEIENRKYESGKNISEKVVDDIANWVVKTQNRDS